MMEIKIVNFKGAQKITMDADPIAVLLGPNRAGKTSACQATALALTGEAMPNLGIAKASAGALVHGGAEKGIVQVKTEDGKTVVKWPAADVETEGKPPMSSPFAAGVCDKNNVWALFSMNQKERSTSLSEILDVLPKLEEELKPALLKTGLGESGCDRIIAAIKENDWDPIHKKMKDHGAKLKGQWEEVTHDNYGSTKADGWIPDDWEEDLTDTSLQTLEGDRDKAREKLEAVIAENAVEQADIEGLEKVAGDIGDANAAYKIAESAYLEAEQAVADAKAELESTPSPEAVATQTIVTCPHCNQNSQLVRDGLDYSLMEPIDDAPDEEEQASVKTAYTAAQALVVEKTAEHNDQKRFLANAEQRVDSAEAAKAKLEGLGDTKEPDEGAIETARHDVAACQARIDKFNAFSRAKTVHASVQQNQRVVKILEPQGLRKKKLTDALEGFHKKLKGLCGLAGWSEVTLDEDDLELCYGPRRFALMSESEKFRTRCIMQVALAQIDGSCAIVIDGADILDLPARKELFKLLMKTGIRAVVSMTLGSKDEIPDWVGKAFNGEKGLAYWIEDAVCGEPIEFK